jgi:2-methylcitrate dehydratase PrpD
MSDKYIAEQIADLAVKLNYKDLPVDAVNKTKTLLLDLFGSMVGTKDIFSSKVAREIAEEYAGPEEATIVGSKKKVAVANAAFANGMQCYGFDFVDDHNNSNAHPSPATIPVSLSISEVLKCNGKELIEAIALSNEVVCRLGTAYLGDMYYQGFHPTSVCGTMGAAVSAAKLLKLNQQQIVYSQGIAGSMAAGLMAWNSKGSITKRLQAGHPAWCGILSAKMAKKGFDGPSDIYEGKDGILHAYSFENHYDAKYIIDTLGKEWVFTTSSIKAYPCCRYSGGHLDACIEIATKYHPNPNKIKKIFIRSSKYTMRLLAEKSKWDPKTVVDLQFSMPYQAARALIKGRIGTDDFTEECLNDSLARKLMAMVEAVEDAEFERRYPDQYSSAVTVTMKDGAEYTAVVDNPKGDKRNPVTHSDVEDKFRTLVQKIFNDNGRVQQIIDYINDLENAENIADLMKLINVENLK